MAETLTEERTRLRSEVGSLTIERGLIQIPQRNIIFQFENMRGGKSPRINNQIRTKKRIKKKLGKQIGRKRSRISNITDLLLGGQGI